MRETKVGFCGQTRAIKFEWLREPHCTTETQGNTHLSNIWYFCNRLGVALKEKISFLSLETPIFLLLAITSQYKYLGFLMNVHQDVSCISQTHSDN